MVKIAVSLDEATVRLLRRTAKRLGRTQGEVVTEAIAKYAGPTDRLIGKERLRLLGILRRLQRRTSRRSAQAVDAELAVIRDTRREAGRKRVF